MLVLVWGHIMANGNVILTMYCWAGEGVFVVPLQRDQRF